MNRERKIVLVGDTRSGKTSLLNRIAHDKFVENTETTIGCAMEKFTTKFDGGNEVTLNIWDTAGQEKYQYLSTIYFRNADAALVVYDCTEKDPTKSLEFWIESYRNIVGPNGTIVIAANKIDLIQMNEFVENSKAISQHFDCQVLPVSAKTGFGVLELFTKVAFEASKAKSEVYISRSLKPKPVSERQNACC